MNEALGQLHIGVLVLSTSRRSCVDQRMSHRRWSLLSTRLEGGESLAIIANFHSEQPPATDDEAYLGGVKKAPYIPVRRVLQGGPERPPKSILNFKVLGKQSFPYVFNWLVVSCKCCSFFLQSLYDK